MLGGSTRYRAPIRGFEARVTKQSAKRDDEQERTIATRR
jgi:hypothetical protein